MATRKQSLFTRVGEEAKAKAQRELLLKTLTERRWNLTATAKALELFPAALIRALRELAPEEYQTARASGVVRLGRKKKTLPAIGEQ